MVFYMLTKKYYFVTTIVFSVFAIIQMHSWQLPTLLNFNSHSMTGTGSSIYIPSMSFYYDMTFGLILKSSEVVAFGDHWNRKCHEYYRMMSTTNLYMGFLYGHIHILLEIAYPVPFPVLSSSTTHDSYMCVFSNACSQIMMTHIHVDGLNHTGRTLLSDAIQ